MKARLIVLPACALILAGVMALFAEEPAAVKQLMDRAKTLESKINGSTLDPAVKNQLLQKTKTTATIDPSSSDAKKIKEREDEIAKLEAEFEEAVKGGWSDSSLRSANITDALHTA